MAQNGANTSGGTLSTDGLSILRKTNTEHAALHTTYQFVQGEETMPRSLAERSEKPKICEGKKSRDTGTATADLQANRTAPPALPAFVNVLSSRHESSS